VGFLSATKIGYGLPLRNREIGPAPLGKGQPTLSAFLQPRAPAATASGRPPPNFPLGGRQPPTSAPLIPVRAGRPSVQQSENFRGVQTFVRSMIPGPPLPLMTGRPPSPISAWTVSSGPLCISGNVAGPPFQPSRGRKHPRGKNLLDASTQKTRALRTGPRGPCEFKLSILALTPLLLARRAGWPSPLQNRRVHRPAPRNTAHCRADHIPPTATPCAAWRFARPQRRVSFREVSRLSWETIYALFATQRRMNFNPCPTIVALVGLYQAGRSFIRLPAAGGGVNRFTAPQGIGTLRLRSTLVPPTPARKWFPPTSGSSGFL